MKKDNKKRNIVVIIIIFFLLLVVACIALLTTTKFNNKEITKQKDKRCVDDICISSVSLEETSDGKLINIVIKNEGKYVVESSCVNLVTTEKKHIICLNKAKPNEDLQISLDYTENLGETIEDYSLEKASEKDAKEANKKREEILNNIN